LPNRIVREGIITSEAVNALGWAEEVFYRRLHSVVDDFGRYYATPTLLRAACYPLQVDKVGNQDIAKWLTACVRAGLVRAYTLDGKDYLEVVKFGQHVRAKHSKFPPPSDTCSADVLHLRSTRSASAPVVEDGDEDGASRFARFWEAYPRKVAKQDALKAFLKLKPSEEDLGLLLKAVSAAKETDQWRKDAGRFIPHASTWLNGRRFEDDVTAPAAGKRMVV
jgi:hypothetical protein